MGEVYRARDSKLGRDVAIKVLPEAFARDADRMARFQREAKALASLDHPNTASIYGLEDSGNSHALA
jgi:serine/threonine protein kinase